MRVTTIGIDLAKSIFQIHGVDRHGKVVRQKKLERARMQEFFVKPSPGCDQDGSLRQRTLLGTKAWCNGTYGQANGAAIRQAVRKDKQNDVADAEAVCAAVTRPDMRFVPITTGEQQAVLSLHRVRQGA